jgi:hypothetical protein
MTTAQESRRAQGWRWVVLVILLLIGAVGTGAYLFRTELRDEWALREFRRAAAEDDPTLPQYREHLQERLLAGEERLDRAARLADDPDPKVRVAVVEVLLANHPRAQKRNAGENVAVRFGSWRSAVLTAVEQLLKDDDETVRKKTLRAVCELAAADTFGTRLAAVVRTGPPAERLIVAEHLAHWNGPLLYQVVEDVSQPAEVRIAAIRSPDVYGDGALDPWRSEWRAALESALASDSAELRRTAIVGLWYAQGAAGVWIRVIEDEKQKDLHRLALQTWTEGLGTGSAQHWSDTHELWYRSAPNAVRCGTTTHVLCEGAKLQIQLLEQNPTVSDAAWERDRQAFVAQFARLGNVLSVLSAVRWYCEIIEQPPDLTVWLPYETPTGAPPKRAIKAVMFQQVKPVWQWCLSRKDGYPTRFLTPNAIIRCYGSRDASAPIPVRPLGAAMEQLLVGSADFDRLYAQYPDK